MHSIWIVFKSTVIGKLGVFSIILAPLLFFAEVASHIDALIAAIPPTLAVIVGVFALRKGQKQLTVSVDGKMDKMLDVAKSLAHAEGREEVRIELSEMSERAARSAGKEDERVEARKRHESSTVPVNVVKPTEDHTLSQRQEKIDKAQEELNIDKSKEPPA